MAKVKGLTHLTGNLKGISLYTRRGSDEIIARTKGGPSKKQIKKLPAFEKVRQNNKEWSGCTKMTSGIRYSIRHLTHLADYGFTGALNALTKTIQKCDAENPAGQRSLLLSQHKNILAGFNLNKTNPFDSVLRIPLSWETNRKEPGAKVTFPALNTDIHLNNYRGLPFFRIYVVMGNVSDLIYNTRHDEYGPITPEMHGGSLCVKSEWFSTHSVFEEQSHEIAWSKITNTPIPDCVSLILSVGIEFGTTGVTGQPVEVKYAGSAKVISVF
ncbi:MAG: hypothetical protein Q8909_10980 [Bacteroidota bacterium]|nr:hypothetical protein [Bacteroidota bacterium]